MPPRLPPRSPSQASSASSMTEQSELGRVPRQNTIHLTPQAFSNSPYSNYTGLNDPRTSSTQSLRPDEPAGPNRRILLIVYIHGFMGNETSFKSFPAHLHSLLTMTLAETHVVYSKIYPRYQSRKNISFARDAFSNWLAPHESDTTDVILVGHSLGGILGAEVVLLPSHTPGSQNAFQHRILGLIAFDTPFLGMHPGVVSTGIASLFRSAPDPPQSPGEGSSNPSESSLAPIDITANDPHFNPRYPNDVNLPVRSNKWERAWYFVNKHYGDVRTATQSYVKSHLEFGGCLADYPGLKRRYDAVRGLEDVDDLERRQNSSGRTIHRVRFVNYYTASTGRIKKQKPPANNMYLSTETEMQSLKPVSSGTLSPHSGGSITPRLSLEEHHEDGIVEKTEELKIDGDKQTEETMQTLDPQPHEDSAEEAPTFQKDENEGLPPILSKPVPPAPFDPSQFTDPDTLRTEQKEHTRLVKQYEKAIKERQKSIRNREKAIAKQKRKDKNKEDKLMKAAKQEEEKQFQETLKRQSTLNPEDEDRQFREDAAAPGSSTEKPKRDRKFCSLPSKNENGQRDPTWIRVYMEGMDEVVAHTSLFFVSDAYAKLVGDTAERIEQWVKEDATMKILLAEQA